jgi:hypothetical protein
MGIRRTGVALKILSQERKSLEARAALVSLPISKRLPEVWRLWRQGGYHYFSGWKSAATDMIRR